MMIRSALFPSNSKEKFDIGSTIAKYELGMN